MTVRVVLHVLSTAIFVSDVTIRVEGSATAASQDSVGAPTVDDSVAESADGLAADG